MARYFGATMDEGADPEPHPSWNVAPTDEVLGVRDHPARRGASHEATGNEAGGRGAMGHEAAGKAADTEAAHACS